MHRSHRFTVSMLCAALLSNPAHAASELRPQWRLRERVAWPPAIVGGALVLKRGDELAGYGLTDGRRLWTRRYGRLREGERTLAGGRRFAYALTLRGLLVLDPSTGRIVTQRPTPGATGLLATDDSVFVTTRTELLRLDETGQRVLGRAAATGALRAARADHAVLYRVESRPSTPGSPKRLLVVDLRSGREVFSFKLLPSGEHQVVELRDARLAFLDYSRATASGVNPRKVFYTEADYLRGAKTMDRPLSERYSSSSADRFFAVRAPSGVLYVANVGSPREPSQLFAYLPERKQTRWARSGELVSTGLLLHAGGLVAAVNGREGGSQLVLYSPTDGNTVHQQPLDGLAEGAPVAAGALVLAHTRGSVACFSLGETPSAASTPPPPTNPPPPAAPSASAPPAPHTGIPAETTPPAGTGPAGFRLYRDRLAGYEVRLPEAWRLDRTRIRRFGGVRLAVPFVRSGLDTAGVPRYQASLQVLVREAAGQDAEGLWRSVYQQRAQQDPQVKVLLVQRPRLPSGQRAVLATYLTRSASGYPEQVRSLCVVSHGVAFELRARLAPGFLGRLWPEVMQIFRTFHPREDLRVASP
ncbi:MAG: PQQ-binding-like beta-propeller repeat protein [Deltaproteobacteria bacterium]|nr:PQQ-binding-like beta-propeller repeat protein [Deltaproteobacteria bacterium]